MAEQQPNELEVTFEVAGLEQALYVISFTGVEEVSSLFSFDITFAAQTDDLSFDKVVGKSARLFLQGMEGDRYIHGMVATFQQRGSEAGFTAYSFQHKGNKPPQEREFCVQYREPTWSFISRLLEEDGYFNEVRFEDKAGEEELFTHAQRDQREVVERNMDTSVGGDQSLEVRGSRRKKVKKSEAISVQGNRTETVDGEHTETIKKDTSITVSEGDYTHNVAKGSGTFLVKGKVEQSFESSLNTVMSDGIDVRSEGKHIHLNAATEVTIKVGSSTLEMKSDGTITVKGNSLVLDGNREVLLKTAGDSTAVKLDATGVKIKGLKVELTGNMGVDIQGLLVKIN